MAPGCCSSAGLRKVAIVLGRSCPRRPAPTVVCSWLAGWLAGWLQQHPIAIPVHPLNSRAPACTRYPPFSSPTAAPTAAPCEVSPYTSSVETHTNLRARPYTRQASSSTCVP